MTDLATLGGYSSEAYGLNDAGQVVGECRTAANLNHAFRFSATSIADLGTLGGFVSTGLGINAAGDIVGRATLDPAGGAFHAFLWRERPDA